MSTPVRIYIVTAANGDSMLVKATNQGRHFATLPGRSTPFAQLPRLR